MECCAHVSQIIPNHGPSHTRAVLIGAGFCDSAELCVRFGDHGEPIVPVFHESGTLLVRVPPQRPGVTRAAVSVSNDGGATFCDSNSVTFTYECP